ncbi:glycosyltransferase [Fodinibius halophilus]|uniref:Glycosyltransferase family 4 protein n=1 Tax=Fodinibius halophilus TaxID=1736908 RepID=A0A6M1T273_9BACT|nr:glycosyltransferase [Fodinibius halophilus]NGP88107.1 glycosyltransferase family 4 protein [Fodinibius halophilus]
MKEKEHLLIIGLVWPEPNSSAAGGRMMNLISLFQQQGWEITFATSAAESEHMADLEARGVDTLQIEINSSDFNQFVNNLQPSMVLFDRFMTEEQFGWRVAEQCPDAIRILDTEDLHCLRRARKTAVKQDRPFVKEDLLREDTTKREIASIYRSDLSLIISEYEMQLLADLFGIEDKLLCYLPFMLSKINEDTITQWPSFSERDHFVMIGNFRHKPNWDAVRFMRAEVWPLIREKLPQAELHIYGSYVTRKAKQLHKPEEGFYIEGRAADAQEVVSQARICLAPLRFGAGLKGKLVEAMQCGTPNITTKIGAEGIAGDFEWSGSIKDKARNIADAAVQLYQNETVWHKKQKQGIRIINERFAKPEYGDHFIRRITELVEELDTHRVQNFTGRMLQHHTMASTKYMSRWIEEKNR